jgi:tRNA A-37 threonylcarbamoyl transferase component Bud32
MVFREPGAESRPLIQVCLEQQLLTKAQVEAVERLMRTHWDQTQRIASGPVDETAAGSLSWQEASATRRWEPQVASEAVSETASAIAPELASGAGIKSEKGTALPLEEQAGRYVALEELGRGGMGVVLAVTDTAMNRQVALKELLPTLITNSSMAEHLDDFRSHFLREAEVTATLQHPGIVPVYEIGRRLDSGEAYYTMKKVEGLTLKQAIKNATGLEDRLALLANFIDVCQTLAYAHRQGVIHRDLKPANIIIGGFGETYVLDWGLARRIHAGSIQQGAPSDQADACGLKERSELTEQGAGTPLGAALLKRRGSTRKQELSELVAGNS